MKKVLLLVLMIVFAFILPALRSNKVSAQECHPGTEALCARLGMGFDPGTCQCVPPSNQN